MFYQVHECGLQWIILIEIRFLCERVLVFLVPGIVEGYLIQRLNDSVVQRKEETCMTLCVDSTSTFSER